MIEEERLFDQISNYISPGDFTEDLYRTVAELLYEQRKEGGLNPAKILNHLPGKKNIGRLPHCSIQGSGNCIQRKSVNRLSVKRY